jgi:predicted GH43/DUF377 family glycosyl hydrolase
MNKLILFSSIVLLITAVITGCTELLSTSQLSVPTTSPVVATILTSTETHSIPVTITSTSDSTPSNQNQTPPVSPTSKSQPSATSALGDYENLGTLFFIRDDKPIVTASGMGMSDIVGPSIIRLKDGKYRMYLQGHNQMGTNIVSIVSNDGLAWTPDPGIRIQHGSQSDLDYEAGEPGAFMGLDGKYYLAYTGRQTVANELYHKILFAISDNGLNWTKLNKVFSDSLNRSSFAASADVISVNSAYIMYYTGGANVIKATSNDGINWTRQGVVHDNGHDSTVAVFSDKYYMFTKVQLVSNVTKNPNNTGPIVNNDAVLMSVSTDGINWPHSYYRIIVKDSSGAEIPDSNLQDPATAIMVDGSLRLYFNTMGGTSIISTRPATQLP